MRHPFIIITHPAPLWVGGWPNSLFLVLVVFFDQAVCGWLVGRLDCWLVGSCISLSLSLSQIYDASYEWITTQGWSFLPLDNYGGGGLEAKFRPLEANHLDYDLAWAQCECFSVQIVFSWRA